MGAANRENPSHSAIHDSLLESYGKAVFLRRNIFDLPKGKHGKELVLMMTGCINAWCEKSPEANYSFTALSLMPILLLQRTSSKAKGKENKQTLDRRLSLWKEGKFEDIFQEGLALQNRLSKPQRTADADAERARRFTKLITSGNVSGATRLLKSNSTTGGLPINDETMRLIREKHPPSYQENEGLFLHGEI